MENLREVEAKQLRASDVECYVGLELRNTVPLAMAVNAVVRGFARVLNPGAIQQVEMSEDERYRMRRAEMEAEARRANAEAARKWGTMR